jgi:Na+/proline symporter
VWERLTVAAEKNPVGGNRAFSYLTMWSSRGLAFGAINVVGNFGTVFCDQTYWQASLLRAVLLITCRTVRLPNLKSLPLAASYLVVRS